MKYLTTVPRYIDGKYVNASPDSPAVVEFPDHLKVTTGPTLIALDEDKPAPVPEKLIPPFAPKTTGRAPHANERDRTKRPSDQDPSK